MKKDKVEKFISKIINKASNDDILISWKYINTYIVIKEFRNNIFRIYFDTFGTFNIFKELFKNLLNIDIGLRYRTFKKLAKERPNENFFFFDINEDMIDKANLMMDIYI